MDPSEYTIKVMKTAEVDPEWEYYWEGDNPNTMRMKFANAQKEYDVVVVTWVKPS